MKKMVLITPFNEVSVVDYPVENPGDYMAELRGLYTVLNCDCVEEVRPRYTKNFLKDSSNLIMLIDENGKLNGKLPNLFASLFYGAHVHGEPIVGNVVLVTYEMTMDGPAWAGLEEERANAIAEELKQLIRFSEEEGVD